MKVEPTTESYSWHGGKVYPKGSTEIPDELAEALGLKQPQPEKPPEKPSEPPPADAAVQTRKRKEA